MASQLSSRLDKLEARIPAPQEERRIVISLVDDAALESGEYVSILVEPSPALQKHCSEGER